MALMTMTTRAPVPRASRAVSRYATTRAATVSRRATTRAATVSRRATTRTTTIARASSSSDEADADVGVGLKAAWYGAEALGRVVGSSDTTGDARATDGAPIVDRAGAVAAIREDYESVYFVTGDGDMRAYDDACEFADPFASFRGLGRFQRNVRNLGAFCRDVELKLTSFEETEEGVQTEWTFSCVLDLPWRPRLAAKGGTTHALSAEHRVVRHYERWDVEPKKVLTQLLKPASKIPENQAEVFMLSLMSGDVVGTLGVVAPVLFKTSVPLWAASTALRSATGTEPSDVEGLFGWFVALACVSQVAKFLRGIGIS